MKKSIKFIVLAVIALTSNGLKAQKTVNIHNFKDLKAEYSIVVTSGFDNNGKENDKNAIGIVQKNNTAKSFDDIWMSSIGVNNLEEFYTLLSSAKAKQIECDSLYTSSQTIKTDLNYVIKSNNHKFNILLFSDYDNTWVTNTNVSIYTTSGISRIYIHFENNEDYPKNIHPSSVTLSLKKSQLDDLIRIIDSIK